jgi:hypothetical protein
VRLVSSIGGVPGGSGNLSTSLSNVARLAAHPKLCGFSTPTAMGQSFVFYNNPVVARLSSTSIVVGNDIWNGLCRFL